MLERDRAGDRRVACINIGRASRFVIRQENLADAAILESAHGRSVGQPLGSKRKGLVCSPIGESLSARLRCRSHGFLLPRIMITERAPIPRMPDRRFR